MIDVADAPPRVAHRTRRGAAECVYAGARTYAAAEWLDALEIVHGAAARSGAELVLALVDTRRFQLTVAPGDATLTIAFHAAGRQTVTAELRRDRGTVELALHDLAEAGGDRLVRGLGRRLEAVSPAWFRCGEADGHLPGLELAACADEGVAENFAAFLDTIFVAAIRAAASARQPAADGGLPLNGQEPGRR